MIKKGDFVELEYMGRLKETNEIFDLTNAEDAKKNNVYNDKLKYSSKVVCVGNNILVKGLDEFLEGKECKNYKTPVTRLFGGLIKSMGLF